MRKITKLQQTPELVKRKRVAAYARVSSGKDAMLHSLSAQISYYNGYIGKRGDWEFAGVYADEALTGTKEKRPEFQRLLADCRNGNIDMVITKSITRFARNTVILLEAVRELKLLGIDVFFEKENIYTMSADGEFMLTLLASYAQEESRSVSENQKWRIRKKFEQGRPSNGRMLGYRLVDGQLQIVPEEAEVVKQIFDSYLSGMGKLAIAKALNADGIPSVNGGLWRTSTIIGILKNEKYTGNLLLQKTYISDHITKKARINRGELPMYYVENAHEAIIPPEIFSTVQNEFLQRSRKVQTAGVKPSYPYTGIIKCGICGAAYKRKHTAIGTKYDKIVWICSTYNSLGKSFCASKQIPEAILNAKVAEALGLTEFDETLMHAQISEIQVVSHSTLRFILHDGQFIDRDWENPSRRESWTDEMKQAAREHQLAINETEEEHE